jgi:hypothetical protein
MLRRDEVGGDLGAVLQECRLYKRSNKSLISLAGAAGLEPVTGAPAEMPVEALQEAPSR